MGAVAGRREERCSGVAFRVQKAEGECVQRRAKGLTLIDCGVGVSDRFEDRHAEVSIFEIHYF